MAKNSYVLGKRIARGGMAEVFIGKAVGEAAFQRICAIKRILPHYSQDTEFVEMFRDEAHICKRLQHANIVQVYDFTEVEGSYALIMEHVDGCDLRTLLSACETANIRLSVPMILYIVANSARGLHYAHTKQDEITKEPLGIVHRDISPQNILLSYEGEVKITDFGIASAENKITETRPGVVKGKYSYMSPEQVSAEPLDCRSDIFSLGIVLWEGLAMKRLFAGQTEIESIKKVQECSIDGDLRELNPRVDEELNKIVLKALEKDQRNRYSDAAEFEKDLLKYLHTNFADFTSSEFGDFLKRILAERRDKIQDDIKETLSKVGEAPNSAKSNSKPRPAKSKFTRTSVVSTEGDGAEQFGENPTSIMPMQQNISPQIRQPQGSQPQIRQPQGSQPQIRQPQGSPSQIRQPQVPKSGMQRTGRSEVSPLNLRPIKAKKKKGKWKYLFLLSLIGGAYFVFGTHKFQVSFATQPNRVMVSINDKKVYRSYTKTPAKITLIADESYLIELTRPGYKKELFRVRGKAWETKNLGHIKLKKLPSARMANLHITAKQNPVSFLIENGLYKEKTPADVELLVGSRRRITYIIDGQQFSCIVNPKSSQRQLKVTLRPLRQVDSYCPL